MIKSYYFVFLYSLPANFEFYLKKTYYISLGTTAAALINIVLNVWFIPIFGYVAAAWTTLISYIFFFVFHLIIANRLSKTFKFPLRIFLIPIFFTLAVSVFLYFVRCSVIYRGLIIAALAFVSFSIFLKNGKRI